MISQVRAHQHFIIDVYSMGKKCNSLIEMVPVSTDPLFGVQTSTKPLVPRLKCDISMGSRPRTKD